MVGITPESREEHITVVDIVAIISLLGLEYTILVEYDDIETLTNRVRTVGELLQNQFKWVNSY